MCVRKVDVRGRQNVRQGQDKVERMKDRKRATYAQNNLCGKTKRERRKKGDPQKIGHVNKRYAP